MVEHFTHGEPPYAQPIKALEDRCAALEREVQELKHREEDRRLEFEELRRVLRAIREATSPAR